MTLVFAGDSITDAGHLTRPESPLGIGYVSVIAAELEGRGDARRVVNAGISGDRAVDLQARWDSDVLSYEPSVLTIYVGVNDTWRRYDGGIETPAADFEQTYRDLLERAQAAGVSRIILMEPFVTPVNVEQSGWLDDLRAKRLVVGRLANDYGATFIGLHELLREEARVHGAESIAADGVHPTARGHELIAKAWLAAL